MSKNDSQEGWSLQGRITRRLLKLLGALWLLASAVALFGVWHEAGEELDDSMSQTAQRFLMLPESALGAAGAALPEVDGEPQEEHIFYQILDGHGHVRMRSQSAPAEAIDASGHNGVFDRGGWHGISLTRADGHRRVTIAETAGHRNEVLWECLIWLVGVMLVLLPVSALILTLVLRSGFNSLETARGELAARSVDDLQSIEIVDAPRELRPWLASVNDLLERLRTLIDAERKFSSHTAHELRTPLAAARAKAQRLLQGVHDEAARQDAQALVRQLDRLTRVSTRMLQMARIESGATLAHQPVDLTVLADMIVQEFSDTAVRERIRVEVTGATSQVLGDIDAIGIALRNLIENALKHGGPKSWITVLVEPKAIAVIDDGPGVPPEILGNLVKPFKRGLSAAEGSGLGLAITDRIAQIAGGRLELRSPVFAGRGFASILNFDEPPLFKPDLPEFQVYVERVGT
jgi:two-component system OmpR family sensor kinase